MRGLLVRQIPIRLVNLSLSGFLVESDAEIGVGATGALSVDLGGSVYNDHVRVARTVNRTGGNVPYYLGGEFSWGQRPRQDSVRLAVRSIESEDRSVQRQAHA